MGVRSCLPWAPGPSRLGCAPAAGSALRAGPDGGARSSPGPRVSTVPCAVRTFPSPMARSRGPFTPRAQARGQAPGRSIRQATGPASGRRWRRGRPSRRVAASRASPDVPGVLRHRRHVGVASGRERASAFQSHELRGPHRAGPHRAGAHHVPPCHVESCHERELVTVQARRRHLPGGDVRAERDRHAGSHLASDFSTPKAGSLSRRPSSAAALSMGKFGQFIRQAWAHSRADGESAR